MCARARGRLDQGAPERTAFGVIPTCGHRKAPHGLGEALGKSLLVARIGLFFIIIFFYEDSPVG